MSGPEAQKLAAYWMDMADESLDAARTLYRHKNIKSCVNRLYYAVFYAASAVLAANGETYGKHTAVRAALHRNLIKPGRVSIDFGKLYDRLFYDRQEADYTAFAEVDTGVVEGEIRQVHDFLEAFRELLRGEAT